MTHRIREAFKMPEPKGTMGGGGGVVEADETYYGVIPGSKGNVRAPQKHKIFSLVERDGTTRSYHVANVDVNTLKPILLKHVAKDAELYTDSAYQYKKVKPEFPKHQSVNHTAGEYARGNVHTNTVESYFGLLKRGLVGTYHHVSEAHLQRYVTEFDFRFSYRKATDAQRADAALRQIKGKRLTYRRIGGEAQA
jgi:transposase-like protein